eukprot:465875_1
MGGYINHATNKLYNKKECRSLWIGLDGVGTTSLYFQKKLGEVVSRIPNIRFGTEQLDHKNVTFTVWDLSYNVRQLWYHYLSQNTEVIIWVVDSSNTHTIDLSANELHQVTSEDELKDSIILIFANKNDLPNIMNIDCIASKLRLHKLKQIWFLQSSCALNGDGINQGFDWIVSKINNTKYKFDEKTVGITWLCSEYRNWKPQNQNQRKNILLISGWIRKVNKQFQLNITSNVTQMICEFYTNLDVEYKFKYYGQ